MREPKSIRQANKMLRSSSMLITRARSVRNAQKLPFRFTFDIMIDSVDKVAASGPVVFIWERNQNKVLSTKAVTVDRVSRKATFGNETLSSEVSLFKNSPQDKKFQDKVVKLAIKGGSSEGKTLGKIHMNLADHAELPSGSKKVSAELNNGSVLMATVQCQFISMGRATPKASNAIASPNEFDLTDEFDLESTGDEEPSSNSSVNSKPRMSKTRISGVLGSKKNMRKGGGGGGGRDSEMDFAANGGDSNGANNANLDKLRRENTKLKRQLEENAGGRDSRLMEENKALKREIDNLKDALKRDPQFHDLVNQLKETKMALAVLQLERDQLALEVMKAAEKYSPKTV